MTRKEQRELDRIRHKRINQVTREEFERFKYLALKDSEEKRIKARRKVKIHDLETGARRRQP